MTDLSDRVKIFIYLAEGYFPLSCNSVSALNLHLARIHEIRADGITVMSRVVVGITVVVDIAEVGTTVDRRQPSVVARIGNCPIIFAVWLAIYCRTYASP